MPPTTPPQGGGFRASYCRRRRCTCTSTTRATFLGDTIWYKGYVTQSNTGTLTTMSRILYVELLTPDGYLVERQQLEMPKDG